MTLINYAQGFVQQPAFVKFVTSLSDIFGWEDLSYLPSYIEGKEGKGTVKKNRDWRGETEREGGRGEGRSSTFTFVCLLQTTRILTGNR